jgi:hypothetical protein
MPEENESNRLLREIRDILSEYKADAAEAKARMDARDIRGQSINYKFVVIGVWATWIGIDLVIHTSDTLHLLMGVLATLAGLSFLYDAWREWRKPTQL